MRFALTKAGSGAVGLGTILLGLVQVKSEVNVLRPFPDSFYTNLVLAGILLIAAGFVAIVVDYIQFATRLERAVRNWITSIPAAIFPGELAPSQVGKADLPKVYDFVTEVLGPGISPVELMEEWHQKNPNMIWALTYRNSIGQGEWEQMVGCFSIIPLSRSAARAVRQGKLTGASFHGRHILSPKAKAIAAIYIGGVVARGMKAQAYILGYMMAQIEPFAAKGIPVYSRPVTAAGLRLLQKYHFVPVKDGQTGIGAVYILDYERLIRAKRKVSQRSAPVEPGKASFQEVVTR